MTWERDAPDPGCRVHAERRLGCPDCWRREAIELLDALEQDAYLREQVWALIAQRAAQGDPRRC